MSTVLVLQHDARESPGPIAEALNRAGLATPVARIHAGEPVPDTCDLVDVSRVSGFRRLRAACFVACVVTACSARPGTGGKDAGGQLLFSGSAAELMPLHDGDTFLYLATGGPRGERLELSRLTALSPPGNLMVTVTEGDTVVGRMHLRLANDTVAVVAEMDVKADIGILYATPLPLLAVPLRSDGGSARSTLDVFRPSDGSRLSGGEVVLNSAGASDGSGDLAVRTVKHLSLPDLETTLEETRWLRPGVGEVRSELGVNGVVVERHQLVCAVVAGRPIGTCPPPDAGPAPR